MLTQYDKTIVVYDMSNYFFNDNSMEEMNKYLYEKGIDVDFDYPHIGGSGLKVFEEIIIIGLTWAQGIGVNALYDILKYTVKYIVEKIKKLPKKPKGIFLEYHSNSVQFMSDFDLTEEQLNATIDNVFDLAKKMIQQDDSKE